MYLEHFGIREAPFSLSPDTSYFFASPSHQEALNVLLVALRMGEGFIKVVGEVGTGKTLLCRKLLNMLDGEFITAYIPDPSLTPVQLRMALAKELGIETSPRMDRHHLYEAINQKLIEACAEDKKVVLILDEAQAMPNDTLEALRLLTNLETEKRKLLQIVMFGQPELDQRLAQDNMRQLKQRITFSHTLQTMDYGSLTDYVYHRMIRAGYQGEHPFTPRSLKLLQKTSRGVPRLINILSHKALLVAFGQGKRTITPEFIRTAARDTEGASSPSSTLFHPIMIGFCIMLAALIAGGIRYLWGINL